MVSRWLMTSVQPRYNTSFGVHRDTVLYVKPCYNEVTYYWHIAKC